MTQHVNNIDGIPLVNATISGGTTYYSYTPANDSISYIRLSIQGSGPGIDNDGTLVVTVNNCIMPGTQNALMWVADDSFQQSCKVTARAVNCDLLSIPNSGNRCGAAPANSAFYITIASNTSSRIDYNLRFTEVSTLPPVNNALVLNTPTNLTLPSGTTWWPIPRGSGVNVLGFTAELMGTGALSYAIALRDPGCPISFINLGLIYNTKVCSIDPSAQYYLVSSTINEATILYTVESQDSPTVIPLSTGVEYNSTSTFGITKYFSVPEGSISETLLEITLYKTGVDAFEMYVNRSSYPSLLCTPEYANFEQTPGRTFSDMYCFDSTVCKVFLEKRCGSGPVQLALKYIGKGGGLADYSLSGAYRIRARWVAPNYDDSVSVESTTTINISNGTRRTLRVTGIQPDDQIFTVDMVMGCASGTCPALSYYMYRENPSRCGDVLFGATSWLSFTYGPKFISECSSGISFNGKQLFGTGDIFITFQIDTRPINYTGTVDVTPHAYAPTQRRLGTQVSGSYETGGVIFDSFSINSSGQLILNFENLTQVSNTFDVLQLFSPPGGEICKEPSVDEAARYVGLQRANYICGQGNLLNCTHISNFICSTNSEPVYLQYPFPGVPQPDSTDYKYTLDLVDTSTRVTPNGQTNGIQLHQQDSTILQFTALDSALSVTVQLAPNSSESPVYVKLFAPDCTTYQLPEPLYIASGPNQFPIIVPQSGQAGTWYLEMISTDLSGTPDFMLVTIRLGGDNCVQLDAAQSAFCSISSDVYINKFLDYKQLSNLADTLVSGAASIPGVSDSCLKNLKALACAPIEMGCNPTSGFVNNATVCGRCMNFYSSCASSLPCLTGTTETNICDAVCNGPIGLGITVPVIPDGSISPSRTKSPIPASPSTSKSFSSSRTPSISLSKSNPPSSTPSATRGTTSTPTRSGTPSRSFSSSRAPTLSGTPTPSRTGSISITRTPSISVSGTRTPSSSTSRSKTPSISVSGSRPPSSTPSATRGTSSSPSGSITPSRSFSSSGTRTPSRSVSSSISKSRTPSISVSGTRPPSSSTSRSKTPSISVSGSRPPSSTPSATRGTSSSPSKSLTPSKSFSSSATRTPSRSPSGSTSRSGTPSISVSGSKPPSSTPSATRGTSSSPSKSITPSRSFSNSGSFGSSRGPSSTAAATFGSSAPNSITFAPSSTAAATFGSSAPNSITFAPSGSIAIESPAVSRSKVPSPSPRFEESGSGAASSLSSAIFWFKF